MILTMLGIEVLEKVLVSMFVGSVQIISQLDSQSKFQIFPIFSSQHIGGPYWTL